MTSMETEFVDTWNQTAKANGWRICLKLTKVRANQLRLRLKDEFWRENWREALGKAAAIPGLRGMNDRGWRANVDFFLRPQTVVKIMEGVYDAWRPKTVTSSMIPSVEETAKKMAEAKESSRLAFEEFKARGVVPNLAEAFRRPGVSPVKPVE